MLFLIGCGTNYQESQQPTPQQNQYQNAGCNVASIGYNNNVKGNTISGEL